MKSAKPRIRKIPSGGGIEQNQRLKAYYEGASHGPRMRNKGMQSSGPNAIAERDLTTLVKRSRHAIANHPYGSTAANTYVDNLVGNGITAKWDNKQLQALWDTFILQCDADGNANFPGMQALLARGEFSDGEMLVRRRWRRAGDGLKIPMQIELLECDHLPVNLTDITRGIRLGIQKNGIGRRTFYHITPYNPIDLPQGFGLNEPRPVAASDVIHYFQPLRAKQDRGIPSLSVVLMRIYEIDEMQDATLVKQKTAQLFAWIIKKRQQEWDENDETDNTDIDNAGSVDYDKIEKGEAIKRIRAGGVHYLDDDEDIDFSSPDGVGATYVEWIKSELRAVAKAIGLTYEQLTGDLTGVNYSSIRAGLVEFRRRMERLQHHLMIFKFCHPVAKWFLEAVHLNNLLALPGYEQDPDQFLPKWKTPRWDWVDPLKDVMADVIENRAGFNSRANKVAERGLDIDEVNAQLMAEQGVNNAAELILDSDPSKVNKSGAVQQGMNVLATEAN